MSGVESAESLLASIVQWSADAIVSVNIEGTIASWNPAAERLFGWPATEAIGQPISMIVPEDLQAQLAEAHAALRGGQSSVQMETVRQNRDGARVEVAATVSLLFDGDRKWIGTSSVMHQIAARRQAEVAMRLRDRAIQAVTQGIIITDPSLPDNPIIYASPSFERLTGYSVQEVVGRNCRFLQGKDTDPDVVARIAAAVRAAEPVTAEILNYRKDGSAFWNELSISPVRDESGRLTHYIGVQADITARHDLEAQYRHAQKMEAVGQLASGVAHDFNNLLTVINGYSDMILQQMEPDHPTREMVELIRRAGDRSASLTRQLLTFSRQQVSSKRVVNLNAIVTNLQKMLYRVIGEHVTLATDLDPGLGAVRADPAQVEQVIVNLAVNARDAMPSGGTLTLSTRNQDLAGRAPGAHAILTVEDTGTGMSAEVREKVFEPFFTTKPAGKGTGLGLAVVHGIVKQHGGHVEVASEPGAGTSFRVYWPRVEGAVSGEAGAASLALAPRGTETLLLVEDDEVVRALGRQVLARCGYTVLEAANGAEAIELVQSRRPVIHTLITDVVMPGMGGWELAQRLAGLIPHLKILYVSGYNDESVARLGLAEDPINLLQKPFSPVTLAQKVRELLDAP